MFTVSRNERCSFYSLYIALNHPFSDRQGDTPTSCAFPFKALVSTQVGESPSPAGGRGVGVRVFARISNHCICTGKTWKQSINSFSVRIPASTLTPTPLPPAGEGLFVTCVDTYAFKGKVG